MNKKQIEGKFGEDKATKYLEDLGYEIICNNFSCMQGEIDIIAKEGRELIFVEVKTRSSKKYGEAKEAVNKNKQKHLLSAIKYYLYKNNLENELIRIDVIEVYLRKGITIINHIKQAIG